VDDSCRCRCRRHEDQLRAFEIADFDSVLLAEVAADLLFQVIDESESRL
jgi:hypothetical protein